MRWLSALGLGPRSGSKQFSWRRLAISEGDSSPKSNGSRSVTDLTAIVISRNEEVRINDCLASCLRSIRRAQNEGLIDKADVVLVDSASTDRTVEIARRFPISIVQLKPGWPLSAGAGRYVGLRHAHGQLILFVDGDYRLFDDWLPSAIRTIRGDLRLAAICGRDIEGSGGRSVLSRYQKASLEALRSDPEAVPVGLYRRDLLEKAGGINPFLKGAEDRDLAWRVPARRRGPFRRGRDCRHASRRSSSGPRLDVARTRVPIPCYSVRIDSSRRVLLRLCSSSQELKGVPTGRSRLADFARGYVTGQGKSLSRRLRTCSTCSQSRR